MHAFGYASVLDGCDQHGDGTYKITVSGGYNPTPAAGKPNRTGGFDFIPEASTTTPAILYGYIAQTQIQTELPLSDQIKLYDDVSNAAKVYPNSAAVDYVSAANVEQCEDCHGKPYMKQGYRAGAVAGLPTATTRQLLVACFADYAARQSRSLALLVLGIQLH